MKTREVHILSQAEEDLRQGRMFYDRQGGEAVGDYFSESLFGELGSLRLYAGIHTRSLGLYRKLCHRFPFAIYYEIVAEKVLVLAILDMRRDPSWIHKRLSMQISKKSLLNI